MKRATFSILFFIKRNKLLKNGDAPIYLRVTVNGKSKELSLKRSIKPSLWDTPRNKVKGNSDEAAEINEYLISVSSQFHNYQMKLQQESKVVTANTLCNLFLGLGEKHWTLKEFFADHNERMKSLVGIDYSPLTLDRYNTAHAHLIKFSKIKYRSEDIPLTSIDLDFILSFESYLKITIGCMHNSAMKHIIALKKVVRLAYARSIIKSDPFKSYKIKILEKTRDILDEDELLRLRDASFSIERIEIVKDLFIFQCYTGLAYKDLETLKERDIQIGIDGNRWIIKDRFKTNVTCKIPLLPIAAEILKKYSNHSKCLINETLLPVPSNQKMNAYLKEVADLCGINKKLHTHMARHTFATTVTLSNSVPIETVSKLLGHKKIVTTQIYSKVVDKKISEDMHVLMNRVV